MHGIVLFRVGFQRRHSGMRTSMPTPIVHYRFTCPQPASTPSYSTHCEIRSPDPVHAPHTVSSIRATTTHRNHEFHDVLICQQRKLWQAESTSVTGDMTDDHN